MYRRLCMWVYGLADSVPLTGHERGHSRHLRREYIGMCEGFHAGCDAARLQTYGTCNSWCASLNLGLLCG